MPGIFTISLDLELYWGVRDSRSFENYEANLSGEREAIRGMLDLFDAHGVHATWATIGFLFFNDIVELRQHLPGVLPDYRRRQLSSYLYIDERSWGHDDAYHFAPDMIELIRSRPGQEIGTHTFSHYYCLEDGQTIESFRADLQAAVEAAKAKGIPTSSLVFPRNQGNPSYLAVLEELGISCYRGNETASFYKPRNQQEQSSWVRALRLLDSYVNLSGYNTYNLEECAHSRPFNVPASRFLRPYSRSLAPLDGLRLHRIKRAMRDAAIGNRLFHLWWHPHNFGADVSENLAFLEKILAYYDELHKRYGMQSCNMGEIAHALERMHVA
ncbi:polysaccharide deacetylase family protein [Dyella acidiphila]|uniref:Polysaccharide deacetylase family protein n=1 Tax=Dyella acidiphila TaxID=2775866 RepID=A0ABR9GE27_9GAMM|nr:polysaccharide deacetylase family protein [Dyella acidiphila]MBE1162293.1 polysaccharide deacetylase family protein [Dyella acidiphila]